MDHLEHMAVQAFPPKEAAAFERAVRRLEDHTVQAFLLKGTLSNRDAEGRNLPERLLAEAPQRFKNDERTLLQALARTRPAFLEVRRIIDEQLIEVVDHLGDPGKRLVICDRSLAARSCRFDELHVWIYPLPHYHRVRGTVIPFREMGPLNGWEAFCEMITHLGGDAVRLVEEPEWFLDHIPALRELQKRAHNARQRAMLENLEALYWTGDYKEASKNDSQELVSRLGKLAAVVIEPVHPETGEGDFSETHCWTWLDEAGFRKKLRPVLGAVRHNAFRGTWRIESSNTERYKRLKSAFEQTAGNALRPTAENWKNLAEGLWDKAASPAEVEDVPSSLLQEIDSMESVQLQVTAEAGIVDPSQLMELQMREWLCQPVPALDGKTIREAAEASPELRARAVKLLKMQVNEMDRKNLETGGHGDVSDLIESTGLTEVFEPPPPQRPVPEELLEEGPNNRTVDEPVHTTAFDKKQDPEMSLVETFEQLGPEDRKAVLKEARAITEESFLERPMCPRPRRRLSEAEVARRIEKGLESLPSVEEILTEMSIGSGSDLLDDIEAVMKENKIGKQFGLGIFTGLSTAWLALVPKGHRIRRISRDELGWFFASLERRHGQLAPTDDIDELFDALGKGCAQPEALLYALDNMLDYLEDTRGRDFSPPLPKGFVHACLFVRAFVDAVLQKMGA